MSTTNSLDKFFTADAGTYGTISVRVTVLPPKPPKEEGAEETTPQETEDDALPSADKQSPLTSYLETPKGKQCVVFLVNGQKHHAWDSTFVSRDLGFKYLKSRTMIMVDLDGLAPHALAEMIRGSRQGLFEGKVYYAIRDRLVAMLKKDDDLDGLQKQAEQKMLEMATGDEAVKDKLDQLIEGHHSAAHADGPGDGDAGPHSTEAPHFSTTTGEHGVVVMGRTSVGEGADLPVLVTEPRMVAARLVTGESRTVAVTSNPREEWANLDELTARLDPPIDGLTLTVTQVDGRANLAIEFNEPGDFDDEEYPLSTDLLAYARFKGHADTRMLKVPVVVARPKTTDGEGAKKKKRVLKPDPTYLKVVSRQPVKLISGGPSVHVKLRWDGEDSLVLGSPPVWKFEARCLSLGTFPRIGFAIRGEGRLALLVDTPRGLMTSNELDFETVATGPGGKKLTATFKAQIIDPNASAPSLEPRKITAHAPDTAGQRRPPYEIRYVDQPQWGEGCWEDAGWSEDDVGCFREPTNAAPLILIVNRDMGLLKTYRDELVKRKLEEDTIKDRMYRFYSHVAFHLYQMFGQLRRRTDANADDQTVTVPTTDDQREQINLVGITLIKMMEVSR